MFKRKKIIRQEIENRKLRREINELSQANNEIMYYNKSLMFKIFELLGYKIVQESNWAGVNEVSKVVYYDISGLDIKSKKVMLTSDYEKLYILYTDIIHKHNKTIFPSRKGAKNYIQNKIDYYTQPFEFTISHENGGIKHERL